MTDWRGITKAGLTHENLVALGLLLALVLLLAPLPGVVLDGLLTLNLALSLALLLSAALHDRSRRPSTFPTWLVASSLSRIVLSLGVARAILTGNGPGSLVLSFGAQMTGGGENLAGGLVLFAMLGIVAFVVTGLGVMRLAEVAARFALDALPGRQMALDSAMGAGRIDAQAGLAQARQLEAENAFYGAMDGVARFLRGDAIACAAIAGLTPLAALGAGLGGGDGTGLVGYLMQAIGLATIILVSGLLAGAAAALVLTRATGDEEGQAVLTEVLLRPAVPGAIALALLALALVPGLAKAPFLGLAAIAAASAWSSQRRQTRRERGEPVAAEALQLQLHLGLGLLGLLAGHDLPALLSEARARAADELGFAVPPFDVNDDPDLPANDFAICLSGLPVAQAGLRAGRKLAVAGGEGVLPAGGIETQLPDGTQATWLRDEQQRELPAGHYHLLEPLQVMSLYLQEAIREHAAELFDLQRAAEWLAAVQATHPASVAALEQAGLGVAEVREVGRALLREGLPLRERVCLVEALAFVGARCSTVGTMLEAVRPALARTITALAAPAGVAEVIELGPALERQLLEEAETAGGGEFVSLEPQQAEAWTAALQRLSVRFAEPQRAAVILCAAEARPVLSQLILDCGAQLLAIQAQELLPLTQVRTTCTIQSLQPDQMLAFEGREGLR